MSLWFDLVTFVSVVGAVHRSLVVTADTENAKSPPNVVFVLADDLGWNDVGFHGANEVPTPNLDALAYDGLILNSHYSEALCTPSRAALLTAKYPIHTGTQHNVILEASPWGLPLDLKLAPEYLSKLGYSCHALGKWHLGFFKRAYTPTFRGFHSHYGFWNGFQDYYSHIVQASFSPFEGYDMRRGMSVDWSAVGKYTTRLLTQEATDIIEKHNTSSGPLFLYMAHLAVHAGSWETPLAAPYKTIEMFSHIPDITRRVYLAMLWELDQSVGELVRSLKAKGILDDTIIVFLSDNGAATRGLHKNSGSNYPLRGEKGTPWEGALRTAAFVWSGRLKRSREVLSGLVHITDWLPTIYSAAGGDLKDLGTIDGINQWNYFNGEEKIPPRNEILQNIDDIYRYSALRKGNYKYINGTTLLGYLDDWVGLKEDPEIEYNSSLVLESTVNRMVTNFLEPEDFLAIRDAATVRCRDKRGSPCNPLKKPCLFNVKKDPCEMNNLYDKYKSKVEDMEKTIYKFRGKMRRPGNKRVESIADPARYNNTWINWADQQR